MRVVHGLACPLEQPQIPRMPSSTCRLGRPENAAGRRRRSTTLDRRWPLRPTADHPSAAWTPSYREPPGRLDARRASGYERRGGRGPASEPAGEGATPACSARSPRCCSASAAAPRPSSSCSGRASPRGAGGRWRGARLEHCQGSRRRLGDGVRGSRRARAQGRPRLLAPASASRRLRSRRSTSMCSISSASTPPGPKMRWHVGASSIRCCRGEAPGRSAHGARRDSANSTERDPLGPSRPHLRLAATAGAAGDRGGDRARGSAAQRLSAGPGDGHGGGAWGAGAAWDAAGCGDRCRYLGADAGSSPAASTGVGPRARRREPAAV